MQWQDLLWKHYDWQESCTWMPFCNGGYCMQQNEFFYGDSKGWSMPLSVLSDFKELLSARYGKEMSQTTVYSTCHIAKQNDIFHRCNNKCWRHYPLQACLHICRISTILSTIMSTCLASSSDETFFSLTGSLDQVKGYDYLREISS